MRTTIAPQIVQKPKQNIMPFQNKLGKLSESVCGLVFYLSDLNISSQDDVVPVPLQDVKINAKIVDFVSEITVTQSFVNVENNPIEVVYMFPIEEEASVIAFEADIDHRTIVTEIRDFVNMVLTQDETAKFICIFSSASFNI